MQGYYFKLLIIDAGRRTYQVKDIDPEWMAADIGGKGLAVRLMLAYNPAGVDPLGPDNHLIIASGPLAGSSLYGSSRYGIFAKSPLTGFYGESYSGGNFSGPLSGTGYDAIVIKGAADSPVWIEINSERVFFHDAGIIWGKDTFETETYLRQNSPAKRAGIMVIGPAGENLVRFAVIKNDKHRVAGRTGMGAVLGSKKIKGVVCYGDRRKSFHDPAGIKQYNKEMLARLKDDKVVQAYRTMGTPMMVDILNGAGGFPTEYWKRGTFARKTGINAAAMAERVKPRPKACRDCFLGCGKSIEVQQGRHKGLRLEGPEYETLYAFGGLCLIDEIEEVAYLNQLCDSLGLDTISAGNLAAFAMEAAKNGKIDDTINYGAADDVSRLLKKIVRREGLGAVLAEGIRAAADKFDMQATAVHVKGMEPAGYDPRALKGMGLAYAVSERGACHLRTTFYKAELAGIVTPDETVERKVGAFTDFEDRCTLFDAFILCRFFRDLYPWEELSKVLYLATGVSYDQPELSTIAAGIKTNTRRFNLQEGLTAADDTLPPRFFDHKIEDGKGIDRDELQALVAEYYRQRGWDADGVPLV